MTIMPEYIWHSPSGEGWVDAWNGWYPTLAEALEDAAAGQDRPWVLAKGEDIIPEDEMNARIASIKTFSLVTDQGTAMPEATLCEAHMKNNENLKKAWDAAFDSDDWQGDREFYESTGNDQVSCIVCPVAAEPIAPLTDEEIDQLANDIITNKTYFPQTKDDLNSAFMVLLALVGKDIIPPNAIALYEDYSRAGGGSVNGRPTFFSGKFFPRESADALDAALHAKALALGLIKE